MCQLHRGLSRGRAIYELPASDHMSASVKSMSCCGEKGKGRKREEIMSMLPALKSSRSDFSHDTVREGLGARTCPWNGPMVLHAMIYQTYLSAASQVVSMSLISCARKVPKRSW